MSWEIAVCLLFFFSVVTYVVVRKCNQMGVPTQLINLAMFLVPVLLYILMAAVQRPEMQMTIWEWAIIIFSSYFCSYLGNVFSLKSIQRAPNPGYSLMISKSYVVLTTLVSVVLFGAELSILKFGAIGLIVVCQAVIMLSGSVEVKNPKFHSSWVLLSIGSFFCWGVLALLSKYLLVLGVTSITRLIYNMSIVSMIIGFDLYRDRATLPKLQFSAWGWLLMLGLAGAGFNYFAQIGYELAPNIGYVNAVNSASIAGVTIISALLFKDDLTLKKLLGIFGVIAGLWILLN